MARWVKVNAVGLVSFPLILVGLFFFSQSNYLLFHSLAELFSILVAYGLFVVAWKARRFLDNGYLLFIGIAHLFVASIDLVHTLAFRGMGVFPTFDTNLPTQLWIAARYLQSISLLVAPLFLHRPVRPYLVMGVYIFIVGLIFVSIFSLGIFPDSYIEGVGLTPFKQFSEYVIATILAAAMALLVRNKKEFDSGVLRLLLLSFLASILAELAFTEYVNVYGPANAIGHLLKIVSFYLIFQAIIGKSFDEPYDLLFRQLKQSEDALRQSESRLRRLVEADIIGVMFINLYGSVQHANGAFLNMLGFSPKELESGHLNWRQLTPPEHSAADEQGLAEALEKGACTPYEKEYFHKDGSCVPVLVGFALLEGSKTDFICFVLDLTDRKKAEADTLLYASQLERSNQDLKDFAFIASHDLQEPLRKIRAFSERVKDKHAASLDPEGLDYIERMNSATERMQAMLDGLLAYSRVTTQARPFTRVNLSEVAQDVVSDLAVRIEQSQGRVEIGDLPEVDGDLIQMRQLMQNLIANALKFHEAGVPPVVRVTGEVFQNENGRKGPMARVMISDNGIGFDEKNADRIFMPFHRLVGRAEYEGSGIGLAICRRITDRHNGSIQVKSAPGQGSTFIISLPVHQTTLRVEP